MHLEFLDEGLERQKPESEATHESEPSEVGGYIAGVLTAHLLKEDNALNPTAPKTLQAEEWHKVLEEFEESSSCCLTLVREEAAWLHKATAEAEFWGLYETSCSRLKPNYGGTAGRCTRRYLFR